jgi:hypothetical protein
MGRNWLIAIQRQNSPCFRARFYFRLVWHYLATTLRLPRLLRTDSVSARPPLYNIHCQAVNSAQRFTPTYFILNATEGIPSKLPSLKGIRDKTLYVRPLSAMFGARV